MVLKNKDFTFYKNYGLKKILTGQKKKAYFFKKKLSFFKKLQDHKRASDKKFYKIAFYKKVWW